MSDDDRWAPRPVSRRERDRRLDAFARACDELVAALDGHHQPDRYARLAQRARQLRAGDHGQADLTALSGDFGTVPELYSGRGVAEGWQPEPWQLAASMPYRRAYECAVALRTLRRPSCWRARLGRLVGSRAQ